MGLPLERVYIKYYQHFATLEQIKHLAFYKIQIISQILLYRHNMCINTYIKHNNMLHL